MTAYLLLLGFHDVSLLRPFDCMDVGSVADVSEVHAASTFRIRVGGA
jgi:hypothetical protein